MLAGRHSGQRSHFWGWQVVMAGFLEVVFSPTCAEAGGPGWGDRQAVMHSQHEQQRGDL